MMVFDWHTKLPIKGSLHVRTYDIYMQMNSALENHSYKRGNYR